MSAIDGIDTGVLVIHVKGEGLSVSSRFFSGMTRTAVPYQFQLLPDSLPEMIRHLADFEVLLNRPVVLYGTLVVSGAGRTEMDFRGHLRASLHETQFRLWDAKRQQEKRTAITNLLAAKLQVEYSHLDFAFCHELARDEMLLALEEKAVMRSSSLFLFDGRQSLEVFRGEIDMETSDCSGFGIRLVQPDLQYLRRRLTPFVATESSLRLLVE